MAIAFLILLRQNLTFAERDLSKDMIKGLFDGLKDFYKKVDGRVDGIEAKLNTEASLGLRTG